MLVNKLPIGLAPVADDSFVPSMEVIDSLEREREEGITSLREGFVTIAHPTKAGWKSRVAVAPQLARLD
jgi:hypothetical protein